MRLVDDLKGKRDVKIKEHVNSFYDEIVPIIKKSAEKGYSSYAVNLQKRKDSHLICTKIFLISIEELLDGCEVDYDKDDNKLRIKWTH